MTRPYVICHMVTSIDGKVTGDFLYSSACEEATELYYKINRGYRADAFGCGRITMEGSFTGGFYPELSKYEPCTDTGDYIAPRRRDFFAVAFDRLGRLGWRGPEIVDDDPGYGEAHIIEVLTNKADKRYLTYLRGMGISYILVPESEYIVKALEKLGTLFGIRTLLLEGGSVINGAFIRSGAVDEISTVVSPIVGDRDGLPLFDGATVTSYTLSTVEKVGGCVWIKYKK
ncbi:MAG: dihydrofolate reductase family protein [Clostridia bacterium]|nr:dihydrofolate reductase family protein [Clostridia bacterium]